MFIHSRPSKSFKDRKSQWFMRLYQGVRVNQISQIRLCTIWLASCNVMISIIGWDLLSSQSLILFRVSGITVFFQAAAWLDWLYVLFMRGMKGLRWVEESRCSKLVWHTLCITWRLYAEWHHAIRSTSKPSYHWLDITITCIMYEVQSNQLHSLQTQTDTTQSSQIS